MLEIKSDVVVEDKYSAVQDAGYLDRASMFIPNNVQNHNARKSNETESEYLARLELYKLLHESREKIKNGQVISHEEMMKHLKELKSK